MRLVWLAAGLSLAVSHASADENTADLATKLASPVASLISVPFQFNYDCCYGPADGSRVTLGCAVRRHFPVPGVSEETPRWQVHG